MTIAQNLLGRASRNYVRLSPYHSLVWLACGSNIQGHTAMLLLWNKEIWRLSGTYLTMEMSFNLRVPSGPCDCSSVSFSEKKRPASSIENLFPASLDEQRFLWALMALLCRSQTILSCETCTCYRPLEWCPKPTHTPPWDLSRLYWPWSRETCVCLRNRKLKCF